MMTPDELEDVRADVWCEPWKDPALFPDCLNYLVTELGKVATGEASYLGRTSIHARLWAAQTLRTLRNRAASGVPFGEPETVWGDLGPTNPKDV